MDYTSQPLFFKARKAARYVQLYGIARTWAKVRAQYHMKRTYTALPPFRSSPSAKAHVGIIGCGNYAYNVIAYYLKASHGNVIKATMDRDINRAVSLFQDYRADYYCDDAEKIIADKSIDLVFICSNHASHAEYAIAALEAGKHVHIEKPHVVDEEQLARLCAAAERSPGRIALGFNRPESRLTREIARALNAQPGPAMFDWFIAGHKLAPDHWYLQKQEGGRVLGNLCHWTDFLLHMIPHEARYPIRIVPVRADRPDSNIVVSYVFGDGSIAAITFSEKEPPFEGIKERFAAHKGSVLLTLDDFREMVIEEGERKRRTRLRHRDHGHRASVLRSYAMTEAGGGTQKGCSLAYLWETADLFLKTKQALDSDTEIVVDAYRPEPTSHPVQRTA